MQQSVKGCPIVEGTNWTDWEMIVLEEVDSTNNEARRRVAAGTMPRPTLIRAERQTAGRGRGANLWWSDSGSLTFSLVFPPSHYGLRSHQFPRVAIAAAVGVIEAVEQLGVVPPGVLGIRWPNDLESIDGKKLGGILPEAIRDPNGADYLVVGIGLNIATDLDGAPPEVRDMATTIAQLGGVPVDTQWLLSTVLRCMDSVMISLAMEAPSLSESWQARDLLLGRRATVLIGDRTLVGRGRGIDAEGRLWLALDDGSLEAVVAGQVLRESP